MRFASIFLLLEFLAGFGPHRAYATGTPLPNGNLFGAARTRWVPPRDSRCGVRASSWTGRPWAARFRSSVNGAVESGRPAEIDFRSSAAGYGRPSGGGLHLQWFPGESVLA